MKSKCIDVYFLQDAWLNKDEFDIDVEGYHVFHHNDPKGNHLDNVVAIVLSTSYYAGWKAAGAAAPTTTDAASDFVRSFIGITIKLESHSRKGCSVKSRNKKETSLVLSLVLAYHPCHTNDDHARFLKIVDDLLSKLPPSEIIMVANMNANVGCNLQKEDDLFAPALGPHCILKRNSKGKNLLGVYMPHVLRVMNTYYPEKHDIRYGTWTNTLNGKQSLLNVIVFLATLLKRISNCRVIQDGLESGHRTVRLDLVLTLVKFKDTKSLYSGLIDWRNILTKMLDAGSSTMMWLWRQRLSTWTSMSSTRKSNNLGQKLRSPSKNDAKDGTCSARTPPSQL
jgi:hypothetical protein